MKRAILSKFSAIFFAIFIQLFSVTITFAQNSNALNFDGANDQVIIADNAVFDLDPQVQFAIQFWLYLPPGSAPGLHHIMEKKVACGADINWRIVFMTIPPLADILLSDGETREPLLY